MRRCSRGEINKLWRPRATETYFIYEVPRYAAACERIADRTRATRTSMNFPLAREFSLRISLYWKRGD